MGGEGGRKPEKCGVLEAKVECVSRKLIKCIKWSDWTIIINAETQSLDSGKEAIDDTNKEKSGGEGWAQK